MKALFKDFGLFFGVYLPVILLLAAGYAAWHREPAPTHHTCPED